MNGKMNKTPVILHLHTHMPYVMNHDMWPHGTVWLSEVVCESYLPILEVIQDLHQEGIRPTISFDFSPILLAQLSRKQSKIFQWVNFGSHFMKNDCKLFME
ncbi:MAG: hypothetical protein RL734_984 [Bacteroidota bacterium]